MNKLILAAFYILFCSCGPPEPPLAVCGNGTVEEGERCDDANNLNGDGCRADCLGIEVCGDGFLDVLEECDDENLTDADGCEADCSLPACENGIKDPGELCFVEKVIEIDVGPKEIVAEDFDQDGLLDLAAVATAGNSINLLFNQGSEQFELQTIEDVSGGVSLVSADFDRNGTPDLATALVANQIMIWFNDGKGNFPVTETINSEDTVPIQMVADDFDQDQNVDLAVAESSSVSIYFNNGTGQFSVGDSDSLVGGPSGITSVDIDGDDQLDLLVLDALEDTLQVLQNDAGSFSLGEPFSTGEGPSFLEVADFDGDQNLDVAVAHSGFSKELRILFGKGDGTFFPSELVFTFTIGINNLAVGDVDQDGDLDLVIPEEFGGEGVHIFLNDGKGRFSQALIFPIDAENSAVALADWNGDGLLDIASADDGRGELHLFFSAP